MRKPVDIDELRRLASDQKGSITSDALLRCATEIDWLRSDIDRMIYQRNLSKKKWIEAAEWAIQKGDFRPLQLRIDASQTPFEATETDQK